MNVPKHLNDWMPHWATEVIIHVSLVADSQIYIILI